MNGNVAKGDNKMIDKIAIEHLNKISKEKLLRKNGLICYTYNDAITDTEYYNPQCMNIGDYIQSLAAKQFFHSIDEFIDRDQLGEYNGEKINMILNAWYFIWKKNKVFSKKIRPLLVAVHINNPEGVTEETIKYFKENEPVGCRDYQTRDFLLKHGVQAYFSGCLTLTLGETYKVSENKRNDTIYFVDYKMGDKKNKLIDDKLKQIIKKHPRGNIRYKTHLYPLDKDCLGALYEAECLIKDYATAKLVITQNIHCALPCLSLGTPVILVIPEFDTKRFLGIYNMFNYVGFNDQNEFLCNINTDDNGNIVNTDEYKKYANFLKDICMKFMHIDKIPGIHCKKVFFKYHQLDTREYKIKQSLKIFKRIRNGNKRTIVLFGFIKIHYTKKGHKHGL